MQHTLQLAILHAAPWTGIYADTGDSHRRVLRLPSPAMPEWRAPSTVLVLGDVHGSFHALLRNLCHMRQLGHLDEDFRLHPRVMLVCLGDYVDYGPYGVEVLWTLLWLQLRNRRQVVLLGGNHEDVGQNQVSGGMPDNFALELNVRFSGAWPRMAPLLERFYSTLPRALDCRIGNYVLHFSHGCATPTLKAMARGPVTAELGEQIAWADVHQKPHQEASSRGGNVQVYGLDALAPLTDAQQREANDNGAAAMKAATLEAHVMMSKARIVGERIDEDRRLRRFIWLWAFLTRETASAAG